MTYDLRLNIDKDFLDEQVKTLHKGSAHIDGIIKMLETIQDEIDNATHAWKPISEYNDTDLTEPAPIGKIK